MKKTFMVYLVADAGLSVEVEIDCPEGATDEQIAELAYEKACEIADIDESEISDWTGEFEVSADDFNFSTF